MRRDAAEDARAASAALVVSVNPGETRAARLDHGHLTAITHHRPHTPDPGAILLGRLGPRLPDGGAFVDLGPWGDGFLDSREVRHAPPTEGEAIAVQVRQAGRAETWGGAKAARLTRAVALTSPRLALGGRRPGAAVSSRIADEAERARLLGLLQGMVAKGESLVARTGAEGAASEALRRDLDSLRADWRRLSGDLETARPPALVRSAPPDWATLLGPRDPAPALVVVDAGEARAMLQRTLAPWLDPVPPVVVAPPDIDLFEASGVTEALDSALAPLLGLPGGGRLLIEPTAALVAIDVDAGSGRAAAANAEALDTLPGLLRLRALAGHILVDLVHTGQGPRLPGPARRALEDALAGDPAGARVAGLSRLGLLELSRERRGPTLAERLQGPEAEALAALRLAARASAPPSSLEVTAPVATLLRGPLAPALRALDRRVGQAIRLVEAG
jgi:Rne/Rng family ribonuclease